MAGLRRAWWPWWGRGFTQSGLQVGADELDRAGLCRIQQLVELTYDTVREPYRTLHIPKALARAIAAPREAVLRKVGSSWRRVLMCGAACLQAG